MIFPLPIELFKRIYAPVTWALILFNYVIFLWTSYIDMPFQAELKSLVQNERYITTQGLAYARYIEAYPQRYSVKEQKVSEMALRGERLDYMAYRAFGDILFVKEAIDMDFPGDQVLISEWKSSFSNFLSLQELGVGSSMGLSSHLNWWVRGISYQFSHSGFLHFAGNMAFLLFFGTLLEPLLGGLSILVVYLLAGSFGAIFFLLASGPLATPLVGASGSVSGLIALYCALYWNRSVRFVYFLFIPKKEYFGYVYLPGWILFLLWLLSDLSGFLGAMDNLGGVAYVAHLGGEFAGLSVGLLFYLLRKWRGMALPNHGFSKNYPMGTRWSIGPYN